MEITTPFPPVAAAPEEELFHAVEDSRSIGRKIWDIARSLWHEACFVASVLRPFWSYKRQAWYPDIFIPYCDVQRKYIRLPWADDKESQGLTVFLTGLSGIPVCWDRYIRAIHREKIQGHIFIPAIYKGGNCSLEKAARPIYQALVNYRERFPEKPICLVGISNGARIAGYCDRQKGMRDAMVRMVSIAGAHFGTPLSQIVPEKFLDLWGVDRELREELYFQSEKARMFLQEWRVASLQQQGKRERIFFATTEDEKLTCTRHSLPRIGRHDRHVVIHQHSHMSILHGIEEHVLHLIREWIE